MEDDPTARVLRLPVHECVECGHIYSDHYMQLMVVSNHLDWFCMECAETVIRERAEEIRS